MKNLLAILLLMLASVGLAADHVNLQVNPQDILGNNLRVNLTLTPVSPLPRVYYTNQFSMQPVTHITDTNGQWTFSNTLWGIYTLTIQGNPPTTYGLSIGTNLSGLVSLSTVVTNSATNLPPNPLTNYYTQANVDALLAGLGGGTGVAANKLPLSGTNSPVGIVVPGLAGVIYFDLFHTNIYFATGTNNTNWFWAYGH